jgi:hypothetical protein
MVEKVAVPAIGVSLNAPIGGGEKAIGLVFQTHLAGDISPDDMDKQLDLLMGRVLRQQAIAEIPVIENSIKRHKQTISNLEDDIERLDIQRRQEHEASGRTGPVKLSQHDKTNRDTGIVNLDRFKKMLETEYKNLNDAYARAGLSKAKKEAVKAA